MPLSWHASILKQVFMFVECYQSPAPTTSGNARGLDERNTILPPSPLAAPIASPVAPRRPQTLRSANALDGAYQLRAALVAIGRNAPTLNGARRPSPLTIVLALSTGVSQSAKRQLPFSLGIWLEPISKSPEASPSKGVGQSRGSLILPADKDATLPLKSFEEALDRPPPCVSP